MKSGIEIFLIVLLIIDIILRSISVEITYKYTDD